MGFLTQGAAGTGEVPEVQGEDRQQKSERGLGPWGQGLVGSGLPAATGASVGSLGSGVLLPTLAAWLPVKMSLR